MNTKSIQSKMKSVKGIGKITKTMEMVSVAKMRKASVRAQAGREFEVRATALLEALPGSMYQHQYYTDRVGAQSVLIVIIGSDKGLCGGYNAQLVRSIAEYAQSKKSEGLDVECFTIGKTADAVARRAHVPIVASFGILPELFDPSEVHAITQMITSRYLEHSTIKKVVVFSQAILRGVTLGVRQNILLPLSYKRAKRNAEIDKIKMEPHPTRLLEVVVPGLVEALLIHAILEARAAEHTARMVAMKSATDNAVAYYKQLVRSYNKSRQASITQEIAEIVSGAASLES
jgi:F-type H+-transporting ATPase subunit gamma